MDGQEQMHRTGKFLYLDWAQAQVTQREHAQDGSWESLTAQQDGYARLGVIHQRTVISHLDGTWQIEDQLKPSTRVFERRYRLRLHWLVPDWPWKLEELPDQAWRVNLQSPHGQISLQLGFAADSPSALDSSLLIVRAGEVLYGQRPASTTWGWVSPTYGVKLPALSVSVEVEANLPVTLTSRWLLPASSH
jgi:hypothetical protein